MYGYPQALLRALAASMKNVRFKNRVFDDRILGEASLPLGSNVATDLAIMPNQDIKVELPLNIFYGDAFLCSTSLNKNEPYPRPTFWI